MWLQCRRGFVWCSVENHIQNSPTCDSVSMVAFVKSRAPVLWLQKTGSQTWWPEIKMLCIVTSAVSGSCSVPYASRPRMKFVFWCWVIFRVDSSTERISHHIEHHLPRTEDWSYFLFIYEFLYFSMKCHHLGQ